MVLPLLLLCASCVSDAWATYNPSVWCTVTASAQTCTVQIATTIPTTLAPAGATQTVDWNTGNVQFVDLESAGAVVTLTLSNPLSGGSYELVVQQSTANPNRALAWPGTVKFVGGVVPTQTASADAVDLYDCTYAGSSYYCDHAADYK